ncbi:MAG: extracellular solute-binding protein [Planctomycetes bacterium]|nr:extracellular solute-binding protein [Planctomycetota bacterium]
MKRMACLVLLVLAACAPTPPAGHTLKLYAAVDREVAEEVLAAFTKSTGIKVEAVYDSEMAKTAGLAKRLEIEKDNPQADAWWSGESLYTSMLAARGCLAKLPEDVPEGARRYGAREWVACSARLRVLVYHAKHWPGAVPEPSSLDLISDARLKDRCVIANPETGTTATHVAWLMAQDDGRELLKGAKANGLRMVASNSAVVRAVQQGDAWLGVTDSDDVLVARATDPDLRFAVPDQQAGGRGSVSTPCSAAIVKGAMQPQLAAAFLKWLVSAEGEGAMARSAMRNIPIASDAPPPAELPALGKLKLAQIDYAALVARWDELGAASKDILKP